MHRLSNRTIASLLILSFCWWGCADADLETGSSQRTDDEDLNTGFDTQSKDTESKDTEGDSDQGTDCTPDEGVYRYCNGLKPCSCDNICAKEIIKSTSMINYDPIGSMCLAECELDVPDSCPNPWETCGKMKDSDPQAFCMPTGKVSGTWRARVFEDTFDFGKNSDIPEEYLVDNADISVDVGWWNPSPQLTKGIVAHSDPDDSGSKYYILTLMPQQKIEYGNTIDKWLFEVFISEEDWKAQALSMSSNPSAFVVQPMLLRIVEPNVSMRTWLHGTVRTTSTFTIDDPGQICTDLDNIESCPVASGSFEIDLFGLSGTLDEH